MAAKMSVNFKLLSLILLFLYCALTNSSKLNVPRVLLPYNLDNPSNFTLKIIEGGCYKWSCSKRDVVLLEERVTDGCANEARVSAITRSASRQTAIILAQDTWSGGILRCDVIIDAIHHLEIITTTRELYVEEAPEEFEVRAYDDQGNEFTTLEGIEMTWELQMVAERESAVSAHDILRFMAFAESPYEMPPAIAPLEAAGRQGYMVLIEGKQTGSARLSVRVSHPSYLSLPPAAVDLMVVANLLLDPDDVYVLPNTNIIYKVLHLKQGIFNLVDIQGTQYYMQVANDEVARLNYDGITVTSVELGITEVILRDKNVKSLETIKQPTAVIHVVHPSYITITIVPYNNPALSRGKEYSFIIDVFDKEHNKIFLDENVAIEAVIPPEYFETFYTSKNGSYLHGVPIKTGFTKIQATLSSIQLEDRVEELIPPLTAFLDLEIFDPFSITPSITVLPWDPVTHPVYNVTLTALGGSGPILWSSSDAKIVGVSQLGVCKTKSHGSVSVTAALAKNVNIKDSAEIHIIEAMGLNFLEGVVEAEVETPLLLNLAAHTELDGNQVLFSNCHKLPYKVEPAEVIFSALSEVKPPEVEGSCAIVEVVGKLPGFSKVSVSYEGQNKYEATTLVAAFRPLNPSQPSSGETVLALGSSRIVVFEGGPLPWIAKPSSHIVQVEVDDPEKVEVTKLEVVKKHSDIHVVDVLCHELGEFIVTITVGNAPSASLPEPITVTSSVKVICALPDAISLSAVTKKPIAAISSCPAFAKTGGSVAHCNKPLDMEVIVTDSENRRFDNISSLSLKWGLSSEELASVPSEPSSLTQVTSVHGFSIPMIIYQVLHPVGVVGDLTVNVRIEGYKASGTVQLLPTSLKASLPLKLVNDALLRPSSAVLFRHKSNLLSLEIEGGSGFFELQTPENDIIKLSYMEKDKNVLVRPLLDGSVVVTLVDICLEAEKPATSDIRVASIASLELVILDRVELGGYLEAEVVAMDSDGFVIPAHALMNLTPHPQSNIITSEYKKINSKGNAVYQVFGRHVGDTTLKVSAGKGEPGEAPIYSSPKPVQVFPPLTLQPRNITLIIGAVYQVTKKGGPYPDATVEFSMENETIATTSHTGVVTAMSIGVTILTGQAVSIQKETGQAVVYSQDTVIVNVIPLSKIRIFAPLTQLETGTTMPLYGFGSEDSQNPLSYATAMPPLLFEWSINNKQVASFVGIFSKNGIIEGKENSGVMRLKAENPGQVTVTLRVKPSLPKTFPNFQIENNKVLDDKLEIKVFKTLKLKNPYPTETYPTDLLMSPDAEIKIKTNRDGGGQVSYAVEGCPATNGNNAVVTVTSDGVVRSGSATGQATVLVNVVENLGVSQTLAVLVEVKKVSYLQTEIESFMNVAEGESLGEIPVGSQMKLHLSYHDNRGRTFHATNAKPEFRPSRFDMVGVSHGSNNNSITVEIRGSGQTVLHIWDLNNEFVSDYIRIPSGLSITPGKVVIPLGGHTCFSTRVRNLDGSLGIWSTKGDAVTLDPVSGVAATHQVGRSLVWYEVNGATIGTTEVKVVPISEIIVGSSSQSLSNDHSGMKHFAPVSLISNESMESSLCNPFQPPASVPPFTCILALFPPIPEVAIKDVFEANAVYEPGQGYGCEIVSLSGPSSSLATSQSAIIVEAVVVGKGLQNEVRSGEKVLSFYAAPIAEISEVKITPAESSASVMLHGLPEVLSTLELPTSSGDGSVVELSLGSIAGNKVPLTLSAKSTAWSSNAPTSPIVVAVQSPLSRSSIKIEVTLDEFDGECAVPRSELGIWSIIKTVISHPNHYVVSIIMLILTVVCIFIGYQAMIPSYKQTNQVGVFSSSPAPPPPMTALSPGRPASPVTPKDDLFRSKHSPAQQRIHLWSDNTEPIYGGATYRRKAYDGSPTYGGSPN